MKKLMLIVILSLSSTVFASSFVSPNDASARIILNHPQLTKQISPVRLLTVNGKNVSTQSEAAWLKPGDYKLKFAATVDQRYTKQFISSRHTRSKNAKKMTLNLKVEENKTYYVGFDTSSNNTEDWKTVVYKVE